MKVCGQQGRNVTVALAVSPVNNLVFIPPISAGLMHPAVTTSWPRRGKTNLRRGGYLVLRRCASTSKSRHSLGQYRAGDASGLQPIPEQSGAGNRAGRRSYA